MKFHLTHGSAITLSENFSQATRDEASFCNGIVFSDQPLQIGEKVCLEVSCVTSWRGAARLGVTTHDPDMLTDVPKYACPDLMQKEGYWARAVPEHLIRSGCRIMLYVSEVGQMEVFVDGVHKGALLSNLPTNSFLWLLIDIYGNTNCLKFVKPDSAPREILAQGMEAERAYDHSCTSGSQSVYRTRLMLLGKDGVGKTSLKRALTGQQHNVSEESTDGIDLSLSCSFSLSNQSSWKLDIKGDTTARVEKQQEGLDIDVLGVASLQEEYYQILASNIVQELLFQSHQHSNSNDTSLKSASPSSVIVTGSKLSWPALRGYMSTSKSKDASLELSPVLQGSALHDTVLGKLRDSLPEMSPGLSDRVAALVEEMLSSRSTIKNSLENTVTSISCQKPQSVILNIWDFAGHSVYHTTHQVFLTSRAVYLIVFNLCHDLTPAKFHDEKQEEEELSTLEYMDFWMRSIHAHAAENTCDILGSTALTPPIFIVGTHRNSLHPDPDVQEKMVKKKFIALRDFLTGKPYTHHLVTPFFAVENNMPFGEDDEILRLRAEIEHVAGQQPYMGEQMPLRWLRLEQELTFKSDTGIHYATFNQVSEMAQNYGNFEEEELQTMLAFYHDLGEIIYYGARPDGKSLSESMLANTVILSPQWLAQTFRCVLTGKRPDDQWELFADKWERLEKDAILEEVLLGHLWSEVIDQKAMLLKLMEKLDLLCPYINPSLQGWKEDGACYLVPMRLSHCQDLNKIYMQSTDDAVFYLDFCTFLPDGLFFRILNRTLRWSQERGGRDQSLHRHIARFYLDSDHDMILHMSKRCFHRIKVVVMYVGQGEATSPNRKGKPFPSTCAQVRNFLESTLADLKHLWMKRIAYQVCVACYCGRVCQQHKKHACMDEACLHFLSLDECLANKVVCCEHRRVKTNTFQAWFPQSPSSRFCSPILPYFKLENSCGNIEKHFEGLPNWIKGAAKLLNSGDENQDWTSLAHLLGYKKARMERLADDINPALALLADWVISNGNTRMAVDLLIIYLKQMARDDVVNLIQSAKEDDRPVPQVFLSYQWESQDQVQAVRNYLERLGYACWMDIGQMGGGDHLNAKIEEGLRQCKVVVACLTPRYVASQLCTRELCLADLLQCPIVPVLMHPVPWPPPGPLALILSQLVYINMNGVGGHGGSGIHADLEDKYQEIVQRVAMYTLPTLPPYTQLCQLNNVHHVNHVNHSAQVNPNHLPYLSGDASQNSLQTIDMLQQGSSSSLQEHYSRNLGNHREPSLNVFLSRISQSNIPRQDVEQVHVTKCQVCVIL